jgi:hypothetical protein
MRFLLFLLLIVLFSNKSNSQIKFLFDAKKAETAGNADWIIDADEFNLGYYSNPEIGGYESNAQRFPTPDQSTITSDTPEDYWTGALSAWAIDLVKLGYVVESLPYKGKITFNDSTNAQDLSNYKVYVVCEPNILFTTDEKLAMMQFVKDGGSLFMIADHNNSDRNNDGYDSPDIWNDFLQKDNEIINPFGLKFDYNYFDDITFNIPNLPDNPILNGAFGDVETLEFYGGTSITIDTNANSSATAYIFRSGSAYSNINVLFASSTYENGKVIAIGDSSPPDDGSGDPSDNLYDGWIEDGNGNHRKLILNASIWLANEITNVDKIDYGFNVNLVYSDNREKVSFNIQDILKNKNYNISIFDISGRKVFEKNNISPITNIQFTKPSSGIFIYKISNQNDELKTGKIIF